MSGPRDHVDSTNVDNTNVDNTNVDSTNVDNILRWDQKLDELDYFELLGVSEDTKDSAALHTAYLRFALTFHPDTHPRASTQVREALTRIFQRGVEAHQVLSDGATAQHYRRRRAKGERRLRDFRPTLESDLEQDLPALHERCRSAGAKLDAQQAARAYARGDLPQVESRLLSALRFDGDANPDVERCLLALAARTGSAKRPQ
jgi:curved DNA-binding protein CbpA